MDPRLTAILSEVFNRPEADIEPNLSRNLIDTWDSLKQMDLIITLEKEYHINLELNDIMSMNSISEIITVLRKKGIQFED